MSIASTEHGVRLYFELQIWFRRNGRIAYRRIGAAKQGAAVVAMLGTLALLVYIGLRLEHLGHVALSRNRAATEADRETGVLAQESAGLDDALADAEGRAEAVGERNDQLTARLAATEKQIDALKRQRNDELVALQRQTKEIDAQRDRELTEAKRRVAGLETERNRLANERAAPQQNVDKTRNKPSSLSVRLSELLASTGFGIRKLLGDVTRSSGKAEGGPFVPLGDAMTVVEETRRQKLLEAVVKTLPLASPLDHYVVTSPFGSRIDPFNHRPAFHPGIDLAAPYRTHIFSTAPGMVIFAGDDDGYGLLVNIDHGHGIVSMYSHLHRIYVVKGQRVPAHFPIGELGSTGRSTGPHIFYEIKVDGTPVDPSGFLRAGGNVIRVGTRQ